MWEMVGTVVMRGGKVREIKRVTFMKKSPGQTQIIYTGFGIFLSGQEY